MKENKAVRDFLDEYGPQMKKMAVICLVGLVLFAGFSLFKGSSEPQEIAEAGNSESAASDDYTGDRSLSDGTIFVDIGGAVKSPMLAELPDGSRVDDAIQAAGGLKQEADMSNINRAEFLLDGQKIYIPSLAMDADGNVIEGAAASGKVNINTADSTQLQTLNGVGPATAQKIIDYRQSNGSFASVEDIKNVSGIGEKTFEKLKDYITI
ncbi:MAG: helix-hairpin-helix domain-containing protein [Clostridia bacterium]|nr:helix-hairpin-helix domain-containing protein [Clostridia bacterium]